MNENNIVISLGFNISIIAGSIAASSMEIYERDLRAYLDYAGSKEMALEPSTLARWRTSLVNETEMSPNTINRMISAIKSLVNAAAEQKYISYELSEAFQRVRGVKVAALKNRTRIRNRVRIEPETMRAITDSVDTSTLVGLRNKAMLLTMAFSGLRVQELAHLKQQQISQRDDKYLLIMYAEEGKNQEEDEEAHISPEAVEAIGTWLSRRPIQSEYIFTSFAGKGDKRPLNKPISPEGAWKMVKRIAEPFAPGVKPHDFRRFVGTQLAKKDLRKAQKALRHKRIETTAKYDLREIEAGATDDLF